VNYWYVCGEKRNWEKIIKNEQWEKILKKPGPRWGIMGYLTNIKKEFVLV